MSACPDCLKRSQLLALLAPWLMNGYRGPRRLPQVLALGNDELLDKVCGGERSTLDRHLEGFDADAAQAVAEECGLSTICPHDRRYPNALRNLRDAPAALYLLGDPDDMLELTAQPAVAVVGSRRASSYGLEMARSLSRDLSACGVTVVSGLALGIDSAAHEGALEGRGLTVAVMAGGADVPYPRSKAHLHRQIAAEGIVLSEMPPGFKPFKLSFPARNRIMAGLCGLTVVVEGARGSGSLITADLAQVYGRDVAAVPGQVTSTLATGPLELLRDGAQLVRGAQDVLDLFYGPGVVRVGMKHPPRLSPQLTDILHAIDYGGSQPEDILAGRMEPGEVLAGLTELEMLGLVRRDEAGGYERMAQ
jgi:DNA processing protein